MSLCQQLHKYFEKIGCDPQEVLRILDSGFLDDYVSDPASKKIEEVAILKQQVPLLLERLNANEFFPMYERVVREIFAAWVERYRPDRQRGSVVDSIAIEILRDPLKVCLSSSIYKHIQLEGEGVGDNAVTMPRCITNFNLGVVHFGSGKFYAPEIQHFTRLVSESKRVEMPKLTNSITLDLRFATEITIGAAEIFELRVCDLQELSVIPSSVSEKIDVHILHITQAAKDRLEANGSFDKMKVRNITIIEGRPPTLRPKG